MLAAVRGGQVRVARSARREPSRGLTLMRTSRFPAGLPSFSATKVRGVCLLGRTRVSSRTAPRGRKRGRLGCAPKLGQAVNRAVESARQGPPAQATRIALGPNRVLGCYVDIALAWGVVRRSNGISYPDAIDHLFTVPLQASGVAQQSRRHVLDSLLNAHHRASRA